MNSLQTHHYKWLKFQIKSTSHSSACFSWTTHMKSCSTEILLFTQLFEFFSPARWFRGCITNSCSKFRFGRPSGKHTEINSKGSFDKIWMFLCIFSSNFLLRIIHEKPGRKVVFQRHLCTILILEPNRL